MTQHSSKQIPYHVHKEGKQIDTVYYDRDMSAFDVTYAIAQEYGDDVTVTWKG
jgi:hypothetical protein